MRRMRRMGRIGRMGQESPQVSGAELSHNATSHQNLEGFLILGAELSHGSHESHASHSPVARSHL